MCFKGAVTVAISGWLRCRKFLPYTIKTNHLVQIVLHFISVVVFHSVIVVPSFSSTLYYTLWLCHLALTYYKSTTVLVEKP